MRPRSYDVELRRPGANVGRTVSPTPKDKLFTDEPWLSVQWDRTHNCIYAEWKGFANSTEFRTSTMRILDAIEDRKVPALVSDNRRLEGVSTLDQLWLRDEWVPKAVAAGLLRIAVVLPSRGLGKISSEEIISRFGETDFATRTFSTVSEATEWASES
jgi:hypothetical protein